ncbi:Cyclin-T [Cyphomyrmex costatus]|uniref:Cyclin-T n=1 Tax=Cyphomyrmex costatus TaxID=456900 RepID=A0A195C7Z9_9HYME|nr:Cyclin-T [Cyphomyrmex costatus]
MAADERWYFSREQLANTPSRRCGIDADKELSYRQQAANFIQDMGQRLVVSQLCINTAIVYMHRFYVFHSLTHFHRNAIAVAAIFLAAKVEEQPRKLEHVIKMAHMCLHRDQPPPDIRSEQFLEQAQDLVFNENVLLQTLGFDVAIDHPHTHVVRCCQLVKASKDLAQTSYFMASNSLHLTTMCLQYKPTVVACFCIHLACKWSNWEIPQSTEGRQWFWYVDRTVTSELLQELTDEFLHIFDKCPSRLKRKIMSISANQSPSIHHPSLPNSPFDAEPRRIQSPATLDGAAAAVMAHFNRSHHAAEDEKKTGTIAGPSRTTTAIDYREYREKKERERLEREKAAAAIGCHITDPNKPYHSHHHKPVSNTSIPNKHQMPSVQKSTGLHHNHHHRPDMKVGQPVQRHSTSNQPNRDPSRQRLPREHNTGVASTSAGITHSSHSHANLDSSSSESVPHRSDSGAVQDSASSHSSLQEKMSNNHSGHRLNALDSKHQAHDKRLYRGEDPRLKSAKYADMNRMENRRKAETLEQRCEEVRKLIEKPLPPPKQADIPYLMNAQQKQPHHAKYNQQQQDKGSSFTGEMKHATTTSQNALPQGTSPSTSSSQKPAPIKTQMYSQHSAQGVSQILKDTIKNGNSQSCLSTLNNVDDTKSEKRSRSNVHEEFVERNSIDVQQSSLHTPPGKHRSLFSPETPIVIREPHAQSARPKSKQKTPPSAATKMKERVSPFASSPTLQDSLTVKRPSSNDGTVSTHKRTRASSISENEKVIIKTEIKTEDTTSLEAMKMLGRVPDLIQPIRDNPSSNGRNSSASSVINDMKPPELIKPFESDQLRFNTMSQQKVSLINVNTLTNGLDLNIVKQEHSEHRVKREFVEHYIKNEPSEHRAPESTHSHSQTKLEYTSPIKSAQSISALLQETLAPMPSLLQGLQQPSQLPTQKVHQEQLQHQQQQHRLQSVQHSLIDQLAVTTQCLSVATDNFTPIASTVDISVLSDNVSMTLPSNSNVVELAVPAASTVMIVPPIEEKRSEHHKSEKKKKKEKHKHKEKSKDSKHNKHKHKGKVKEKHREKKDKEKSEETPAAAPIKITIPKDKLNLGMEASPTVVSGGPGSSDKNISPQSTVLKIKIPKERLKGTDNVPSSSPAQPPMMQGPLKIKIRTDGISRSSAQPPPSTSSSSSSSNGASGSSYLQLSESSANETTSRKRERVEMIGDSSSSSGLPPTKKQAVMIPTTGYGQGHRPGERQNGRHYNSGNNNKVRGRGVRQHHGGRGPPLHHAVAGQRGNASGHYQREIYGNGRGSHGSRGHQHHQAPYNSHHPPAIRGDVGGYPRGTGQTDQGIDSYFYTNYHTPMFNTSTGYVYDPAYQQYYQQFHQQSQYSMYPTGSNLIVTPDGTINTSVPPPSLLPNHLYQNQNIVQSAASTRQEDTQLLPPPPLQPPPSPPPLPSGPPPPPPPPPPPSMSE